MLQSLPRRQSPSCILVLRFVDGGAYDVEITDDH